MAELLEEPVNVRPGTEAWQQMLYKTTFVAGGFMDISLTNMSNDGAPQVMAGSRFELNGSLYYTEANENISGWANYANGTDNYIYAVPSGEGATFSYGNGVPTYNPAKGGWYYNNNRALFKLYKNSSGAYTLKTPLIGPVMPVLQPVPFVEIFGVTNIDNINAPQVMAGSKFILNGRIINISADTGISGSPVVGTDNYIYAVPSGEGATFSYSNGAPTYDLVKGGWYRGTSRSIAKFFYVDGRYNGKVIMDRHNYGMNMTQPVLYDGGYQILNTTETSGTLDLSVGIYRYEVKGGTGGNGGKSGAGIGGNAGGVANVVSGNITFEHPGHASYAVGRDGNSGSDGTEGTAGSSGSASPSDGAAGSGMGYSGGNGIAGGGGGGASGVESVFNIGFSIIKSIGGTGGRGGGGSGGYGGFGGNGGVIIDGNRGNDGYYGSVGSSGVEKEHSGGSGGRGGYGGIGGTGGKSIAGSSGGDGGDGGNGGNGGNGGAGGSSYAGGDGGAGGKGGNGGSGGSGIKTTTSGYIRLWRLW
jgi:hypothetical protein